MNIATVEYKRSNTFGFQEILGNGKSMMLLLSE